MIHISIEGMDGVGKSTTCTLLADRLGYKLIEKPLHYLLDNNIECMITGLRKSEGGIRSVKIKTCFDIGNDVASYRPLFWLSNDDESEYIKIFDIKNSDCYTKYGMKRTGCAGCPYNRNLEKDLKVIEEHEPLLYIACNTIFKESYAYTRKYKEFCEKMKCN